MLAMRLVLVLAAGTASGAALRLVLVLVAQRNIWRRSEAGGGAGDVQPSLVSP